MFLYFLQTVFSNLVYLALHVTGGAFPPPLSAKEESELITEMENGNEAAKQKLIEHNLRLVVHITKKYYNGQVDQDDLISIGTIGLIKGISSFKSSKDVKLATYTSRCIENEILMYFRNLKKSAGDLYISDPIDTDKEGNALTLLDVISDDVNIVDEIDTKIKTEHLQKYLNECLTKREKLIIEMRYGLYGKRELTQRETAQKLNISRSYVSRIEKKALEKLFKKFEGNN